MAFSLFKFELMNQSTLILCRWLATQLQYSMESLCYKYDLLMMTYQGRQENKTKLNEMRYTFSLHFRSVFH